MDIFFISCFLFPDCFDKMISMKVAIIGSSGAGLYSAIFQKKNFPKDEVHVFDKNIKIARKLRATGNGKGNILNMNAKEECYNNPSFMRPLLMEYNFSELQGQLASLGIILCNDGDLVYPLSKDANAYADYLAKVAQDMGIAFHNETKVIDYKKDGTCYRLFTDKGDFLFDKIIFSTGGKSQEKLGSDGSLFKAFANHGYKIIPLKPSLCPIKTKEKTKSISGLRHEAKATLTYGDQIIREEEGELLFKDDGLSGIMIFNLSAILNRLEDINKSKIYIDLFPKVSLTALTSDLLDSSKKHDFFLDAYFVKPFKEYLLEKAGLKEGNMGKAEIFKLAKTLKGLLFQPKELYGFDNSQVSAGGIALEEVDCHLQSKKEEGIYFVGECLDIDGLCGGYNLTWCLISSLIVTKKEEE